MSTPEKHQKNKKIENTIVSYSLPTTTPNSCTSASKKPSNQSEMELKIWPPSSSTPLTSKPKKTHGHSSSPTKEMRNSTKITQDLEKSFYPREESVINRKYLSSSGYTHSSICFHPECSLKLTGKLLQNYLCIHGTRPSSEKGMKRRKIKMHGTMPGMIGSITGNKDCKSVQTYGTS